MRILVTDGDNRATLAITRSLGRAGHEVLVGEKQQPSLAQTSNACAEGVVYPDPVRQPDAFVAALVSLVRERQVDALLPVSDITTFLVAGHRHLFPEQCGVPFPTLEALEHAADKVGVVDRAVRLGLPVPQSVVIAGPDAPIPALPFPYPVVVKPRQSRVRTSAGWVSSAVSYAADAESLRRNLSARPAHEFPLMVQERIEGPGVGVFACYDRGRPVALFSHRRLRERPPWGGVSVLSESAPLDPAARDAAVRLLDDLHWHGVAMVEFKRDLRDGQPKLMEINGRFWGSLQLAIDAGVDFPALLVGTLDPTAAPPAPVPYHLGVRSRWFWGDVDSLLLTLVGGRRAPAGFRPRRLHAVAAFLALRGRELHWENPRWDDRGPWWYETRRRLGFGPPRPSQATPASAGVAPVSRPPGQRPSGQQVP